MGKGSYFVTLPGGKFGLCRVLQTVIFTALKRGAPRELWHFKADHQVSGSPLVYKDSVYCGAADGSFYCLESRTGRLRWRYKTGGAITGSPIVYNDILYIGSCDHILYAFDL